VAQNHEGVVRVVLDVNGVKEYSASLTSIRRGSRSISTEIPGGGADACG